MLRTCLLLIVLLTFGTGSNGQNVSVIKFDEMERIMSLPNDTIYVINFWATWCVPCVKEFPAFQQLARKHKNEKVQVVMVSLDFKKEYEQTLIPFIKKHATDGRVVLLDEPDYNSWINKVNSDWQGEIPVTLIINNAQKRNDFYPHDFNEASLEQSLANRLDPNTVRYATPAGKPKKNKE